MSSEIPSFDEDTDIEIVRPTSKIHERKSEPDKFYCRHEGCDDFPEGFGRKLERVNHEKVHFNIKKAYKAPILFIYVEKASTPIWDNAGQRFIIPLDFEVPDGYEIEEITRFEKVLDIPTKDGYQRRSHKEIMLRLIK